MTDARMERLGDRTRDTEVDLVFDEEVYGGTFGGPLVRDRAWFFAAGRWQESDAQTNLQQTNLPFTTTTKNQRFEAKGLRIAALEQRTIDTAQAEKTAGFAKELGAASVQVLKTDVTNLEQVQGGADMRNQPMGLVRLVLAGARLKGARLARANLSRADLSFADLREADLSGVDLTRAKLVGADFTGATLTTATLDGAEIDQAIGGRWEWGRSWHGW